MQCQPAVRSPRSRIATAFGLASGRASSWVSVYAMLVLLSVCALWPMQAMAQFVLTIDDVSVSEGDVGSTSVFFDVRLNAPAPAGGIFFDFSTADGSADSSDYESVNNYKKINAGSSHARIEIGVYGDYDIESDETFFLNLLDADGATIGDGQAVATILDDDSIPRRLSIDDAVAAEGDALHFAIMLDKVARPGGVSFDVTLTDGTAIGGVDYQASPTTRITIPQGERQADVFVASLADDLVEDEESFRLEVANVVGAEPDAAEASGTITDTAASRPIIDIEDTQIIEGDSGVTPMAYRVTLSEPAARTVSVDYRSSSDEDAGVFTGRVIFRAGETVKFVTVPVAGDTLVERDLHINVELFDAVNADLGNSQARGIVYDDDTDLALSPISLPDGRSGEYYDEGLTAYGGSGPYTMAITAGALPPGMQLVRFSTQYYLAGMLTSEGTYNFTVTVTDSSSGPVGPFSTSRDYTVVIAASVLELPPTTLSDGQSREFYQEALNPATGGTEPYSYAVTAGALPNGVEILSDATLSGVPSQGGRFDFTITVTDSAAGSPKTASRAYSLVIVPLRLEPSYSPLNMYYGRPYTQTFQAFGSDGPFAYAVTSGTLPPGIALVGSVLSGVPTVPGNYQVRIAVTDTGTGASASNSYTIVVNAPPFVFTPNTMPNAGVGESYSQQIFVDNAIAPYQFTVSSGSLPPGLSLSGAGLLSGQLTTRGFYAFEITVLDANSRSGRHTYTMTVASLALVSRALPDANVFQSYLAEFGPATGGVSPYHYTVTAGSLPDGLSLSGNGAINGTPTQTGTYAFTVTATDSAAPPQSVSAVYTINVVLPTLVLSPDVLPEGFVGQTYFREFQTINGNFPYTYAITAGTLPPGVSLTQYFLFGRPTAPGRYDFSVTVTDGTPNQPLTLTREYSLLVSVLPLQIKPLTLSPAEAGRLYISNITASGGVAPYSFQLGSGQLPPGMSLGSDGLLQGTPSAVGAFDFTVVATDSASGTAVSATREYRLEVALPALSMYIGSYLPPAVGVPYSTEFRASNGTAPYRYAITAGALPTGLTLAEDGRLSGTPTVEGGFDFTVTATDSSTVFGPLTLSKNFSLLVGPTKLVLETQVLPTATEQTPYSARFVVVGGTPPYRFELVEGILPPGLTLNADGTITGTLSQLPDSDGFARQYFFEFKVIDAEDRSEIFHGEITAFRLRPSLSPNAVPAGVSAMPYQVDFTVAGGVAPYRLDFDGPLPAGLSFDAAIGRLGGTPTQTGRFEFQIRVTDARDDFLIYSYVLNIATPTIALTPGSVPAGTAGVAYSQTFVAVGGVAPYLYSVGDRDGGVLPPGLSLSDAGVLSGTPTMPGTFTFSIVAVDSTGGIAATVARQYTMSVSAPTISISPVTLPNGTRLLIYGQTLSASGGNAPYSFTVSAGGLPAGLTLNPTGVLSGTPTVVGNSNVTITATDARGFTGAVNYALVVNEALPVAVDDAATATGAAPVNIAVTANDTGPFASIAIATAPAGGTAVVSGFDVVYTANPDFVGTDIFTYTLAGPGGSAEATVTVTVGAIPVARSRSLHAVAGVPMDIDVTEGATGGPFAAATLVTIVPANSGTADIAQVGSGANARYVMTFFPLPDYAGTAAVTFTVDNGFATSAVATIAFDIAPRPGPPITPPEVAAALGVQTQAEQGAEPDASTPTARSRSVDTIAGVPVDVELTDGATGGPFTSATLVALTPASSGTAAIVQVGSDAVARYRLTYTPAAGYTGAATATFTLGNAVSTSAVATIAIKVAPRPDPSGDAESRGLLNAQVESAQRFATTQTGNFQQRMERMHGAGEGRGFANGLSAATQAYCPQQVGTIPGRRCERPAGDTGAAAMAQARDSKDSNAAFGVWASGMIRSGNQDGRNGDASIDFETDGVSVGADYRLNDAFAFGGGLGYGRDESDIGDNGSRGEADAFTLALYASYSPGERWFVDMLLGYQSLGYDLRRHIAANDSVVDGSRDGTQWFGSVSTGADIQRGNWQFTPYARMDLAQATLDGYSETGDPLYALAYGELDVETTTGNAGVRIDYRRETDWGAFSPQFRLEYQRDFKGNGAQTIQYADAPSGPFYRTTLSDFDRTRLMLGAGLSFNTDSDWSFKLDYRGLIGSGGDRDHGLQFEVGRRY